MTQECRWRGVHVVLGAAAFAALLASVACYTWLKWGRPHQPGWKTLACAALMCVVLAGLPSAMLTMWRRRKRVPMPLPRGAWMSIAFAELLVAAVAALGLWEVWKSRV